MAEAALQEVWWREGVRFTCLGCGRCCRGEPGAIFFTFEEGERVRKHLGVDAEKFVHDYVTGRWGHPSFLERPNGDCVFYKHDTARCTIYSLRPLQCSLFPFWPSVLESKAEWDEQACRCPGMNAGRLYSAEEIHVFLCQCPFGDL
jgi:Fe-S-cluster containining protein